MTTATITYTDGRTLPTAPARAAVLVAVGPQRLAAGTDGFAALPEPPGHGWLPWMRGLGMSEPPTVSGLGMSELACRRHQRAVPASGTRAGGLVTRVPRGGMMAPQASSAVPLSLETGPEPRPASPRLALAEPPADAQRDRLRPLEAAQCSLCGIALPLALLVPDGGQACADIRWYCKDAKSCTERWTTARPPGRAPASAVPGTAVTGAGEPAPEGAPAGRPGGTLEEATPAG
jgi:hypothetical protein